MRTDDEEEELEGGPLVFFLLLPLSPLCLYGFLFFRLCNSVRGPAFILPWVWHCNLLQESSANRHPNNDIHIVRFPWTTGHFARTCGASETSNVFRGRGVQGVGPCWCGSWAPWADFYGMGPVWMDTKVSPPSHSRASICPAQRLHPWVICLVVIGGQHCLSRKRTDESDVV